MPSLVLCRCRLGRGFYDIDFFGIVGKDRAGGPDKQKKDAEKKNPGTVGIFKKTK
jgi:hypothetical protein